MLSMMHSICSEYVYDHMFTQYGVVVQVVPPSKCPRAGCPPRQFALGQDVPQGTLCPRANCPLLVQNAPHSRRHSRQVNS